MMLTMALLPIMATVLLTLCCVKLAVAVPPPAAQYRPTWDSLDSRPTPKWWTDQKFSLFMHWGLYAVPSFCPATAGQHTCYAEHFWDTSHTNGSAQQQYMVEHYGPEFIYQDFAPLFKCENFDAAEWASLFKSSGAQGLTMTSKHHEGWTLWPNPRHANWNAMDTGPHRDLLQEVGDAVRAQGLRFGFYYSLLEWDRQYTNDTGTAHYRDDFDYVNRTMIPDLKDLVTRYQPDVLYADGEWDYPSDHWQTKPFLAWLFNDSPVKSSIAINDRWGNDCRGKHGGFYVCEYGGEVAGSCITDKPAHPWTAHEGMGKSFVSLSAVHVFGMACGSSICLTFVWVVQGYNRLDIYKPPTYFVGLLVQAVAFGGHLQLNVGPTADGRVPQVPCALLARVLSADACNAGASRDTATHGALVSCQWRGHFQH
jgi:alpha-L-fucosidase